MHKKQEVDIVPEAVGELRRVPKKSSFFAAHPGNAQVDLYADDREKSPGAPDAQISPRMNQYYLRIGIWQS